MQKVDRVSAEIAKAVGEGADADHVQSLTLDELAPAHNQTLLACPSADAWIATARRHEWVARVPDTAGVLRTYCENFQAGQDPVDDRDDVQDVDMPAACNQSGSVP